MVSGFPGSVAKEICERTVPSGRRREILTAAFRPQKSSGGVAGEAGSLSLEVVDRSGAVQYAWYGADALETRVDVRGMGPFSVRIRGEQFRGSFALSLEP